MYINLVCCLSVCKWIIIIIVVAVVVVLRLGDATERDWNTWTMRWCIINQDPSTDHQCIRDLRRVQNRHILACDIVESKRKHDQINTIKPVINKFYKAPESAHQVMGKTYQTLNRTYALKTIYPLLLKKATKLIYILSCRLSYLLHVSYLKVWLFLGVVYKHIVQDIKPNFEYLSSLIQYKIDDNNLNSTIERFQWNWYHCGKLWTTV